MSEKDCPNYSGPPFNVGVIRTDSGSFTCSSYLTCTNGHGACPYGLGHNGVKVVSDANQNLKDLFKPLD
jgi:hypothetical protein